MDVRSRSDRRGHPRGVGDTWTPMGWTSGTSWTSVGGTNGSWTEEVSDGFSGQGVGRRKEGRGRGPVR